VTITHHPLDDTLAAYAAGSLAAGPRLVVEAHLQACAVCRRRLRAIESVGGALLAGIELVGPSPEGLLLSALHAIDGIENGEGARGVTAKKIPFFGAPASMRGCTLGRWRFVQPGLRVARVTAPGESVASALLIRVGAGQRMLPHGHEGIEYTTVLSGAFTDVTGRYGPGDYVEGDEEIEHQPIAEGCEECLYLAAFDGHFRMKSLMGRVAQSLLGL
jgi:putative transcriptional regulator